MRQKSSGEFSPVVFPDRRSALDVVGVLDDLVDDLAVAAALVRTSAL